MKKRILFFISIFISLASQAQPGPRLVGMTNSGGNNYLGDGTIIQYIGGGTSVSAVSDLPVFAFPKCATLTEAPNGKFYGLLTSNSPASSTLIEYDYPSNRYITKASFFASTGIGTGSGFSTSTVGGEPYGSLVLAKNTIMYGLTHWSGSTSNTLGGGMLFSYRASDTFVTNLFILPNNAAPVGSMIQAADSNLYGLTTRDGTNTGGTIFSYNIDSGTYTSLYSLPDSAFPYGTLLEVGSDTLYGMTQFDGVYRGGTIFRYLPTTGSYSVLYNLPSNAHPTGSLIHATNGLLYGFTTGDGNGHSGTLFAYDIGTGVYDTLHNFSSQFAGSISFGDPFQASDGIIYGMTENFIFQYNISTSTYNLKVNFNGNTGDNPIYGHLTEYKPGITQQPTSTSICIGSSVRFYASDSTASAPAQWQVSIDSGFSFNNISGATSTNYAFVASASQNGYLYRAVFSHALYSDTSIAASLTVWQPDTLNLNSVICYGGSASIFGRTISTAGVYVDTILGGSVHGCDSIILFHLAIYPLSTDTDSVHICNGQTYTLGTHSYAISGTYIDTLQGAAIHGCDSIVTLRLNIYPKATDTVSASICPGGSYTFLSHTYSVPGTYTDTIPGAAVHGCDSIVTLQLTAYSRATGTISASICPGSNYIFLAHSYSTPGTYTDTISGAALHGCDSVVTLRLTAYSTAADTISASMCPGHNYTFMSHTYASSGYYSDTLIGASRHGCDSIVTLHLNVYGLSVDTITESACLQYSFTNHTYTLSGTYTDTLSGAASHGCDSMVTIHLTIHSSSSDTITASTCMGHGFVLGGHTYTTGGTYTDTLSGASAHGCDSIVFLHLYILGPDSTTQTSTIMLGQYLIVGTDTLHNSGTYLDTLTDRQGCDSIVTTHLTVVDGITDLNSYHFTLYPNPSSGSFIINDNYPRILSIQIINILGERLKTFTMTSAQQVFDISDLAVGVYEVRISEGAAVIKVMKVIKD